MVASIFPRGKNNASRQRLEKKKPSHSQQYADAPLRLLAPDVAPAKPLQFDPLYSSSFSKSEKKVPKDTSEITDSNMDRIAGQEIEPLVTEHGKRYPRILREKVKKRKGVLEKDTVLSMIMMWRKEAVLGSLAT